MSRNLAGLSDFHPWAVIGKHRSVPSFDIGRTDPWFSAKPHQWKSVNPLKSYLICHLRTHFVSIHKLLQQN
jgi:hypothetical protein